jgi:predicted metal-dependent HD superfamily phosphohydrolase
MLELVVKKSLNIDEEQELEVRFLNLCDLLKMPREIAIEEYREVYTLYNHTDRYYHNLVHVWNFLSLLDSFRDKILEPALFELSIWYHDAIYEAKNKDNEFQSAILVQNKFKNYLNVHQLDHINGLIMSTNGHYPKVEHEDVYWFLDFDLAILATDYKTYKLYSDAIWQEYKVVYPKILYKMGRKKVLKTFLSRQKLYFSEVFFEENEKKARRNIQLELNGE